MLLKNDVLKFLLLCTIILNSAWKYFRDIYDGLHFACRQKKEEKRNEDAEKIYGNKKAIINLDVISRSFEANDVVTVNTLKEKHLIAKNVYFVKVLARGVIDKPLVIKAQDFSIDAAKMIQLTGGKVVMLTKRKYF